MYHIITNPSSRSGQQHTVCSRLIHALTEQGADYRIYETSGPGSAHDFAEQITSAHPTEHSTADTIVVLGGDGTINEALSGIRDFSQIRFGFIPAGSSNDLARGLSIPDINSDPDQKEAIRRIVSGDIVRSMDLGQLHYDQMTETYSRQHMTQISRDQVFAVSCGIGFDAAICEEALNSGTKDFFNHFHLGKLTYGTIAVRQLFHLKKTFCEITLDDNEKLIIDHLIFAACMNTPYEGGGYRFAPDADPNDGYLNLSAVGNISKFKALMNFPAAHSGTYYKVKGVFHARAHKIQITVRDPLWVHTDGEVAIRSTSITVQALPGKLQMIV